ncbi:MAG: O-succinylbenzoate-CoA ligase [Deltaproteobacteria bacterium]|nr:O-succinylbenzoate-CoA ligase [Deltaproteobacteria bacterium]
MRDTVPNWLEQRARTSPGHPALISEGRAITYAALADRVALVSGRLHRLGVRRGVRIGLLMGNRPEFVEILHAAARVGAVVVPLNGRLSPVEITQQLVDCAPRVLFHDHANRETVAVVRQTLSLPVLNVECDPREGEQAFDAVAADPDESATTIDLAAAHSIIYTSGSSGRPKGVRLTFGNVLWSALGSAFNIGVHTDDRWLACLPFCHVGGLSILLRSVIYGTTAVIHNGFDPARVDRALEAERVTIISVVANMLQRLLDLRGTRPAPPWLRCVLAGGGPVPLALLQESRVRGFAVTQTYGLTETASQATTLAPADAERKIGSAGKPLLGTEVMVWGADGPAPAGQAGEIFVRGPSVSPGYLDPADDTNRQDGWLRTGDLGRLDDEGYLYVLGRRDDMIICGGENIYPAEVEAALQAHASVAEACVYGVPDERWGAAVAASVRLRAGWMATVDELAEHSRRRLARFKIPRHIEFVDDFPRTAAGKIVRSRVRNASLRRNFSWSSEG